MTEHEAKKKLVEWVNAQIGYREGYNNSNKYSAMAQAAIGWDCANQPWCSIFVAAAFSQVFGADAGSRMLCASLGTVSAAVMNNESCYLSAGRLYYSNPQVGDQVFYNYFNHTGIVTAVDGNRITTVDGNYSDGVTERHLSVSDGTICGYGRPKWDLVTTEESEGKEDETDFENVTNSRLEFKNGDLVRVSSDAVWYTGQRCNSIVWQHDWYVLSQFNDRVVINESDDGNYHIMSPIAAKYLTLVKSADDVKTALEEVDSYIPEEDESHIVVTVDTMPKSEQPTQPWGIGQSIFRKLFGHISD